MSNFHEKFAMSKFATQQDRQAAIEKSWEEMRVKVLEQEEIIKCLNTSLACAILDNLGMLDEGSCDEVVLQ